MANKLSLRLLRKMGVPITLKRSDNSEYVFYSFLQPLRYKNKLYLSGAPTELGYDSLRKYLLITSPDSPLDIVDGRINRLYYNGVYLKVDHYESVYFKSEPYYHWAIVSKEA